MLISWPEVADEERQWDSAWQHLGFTGHSCWNHLDLQSCAKTKGDVTIALGELSLFPDLQLLLG